MQSTSQPPVGTYAWFTSAGVQAKYLAQEVGSVLGSQKRCHLLSTPLAQKFGCFGAPEFLYVSLPIQTLFEAVKWSADLRPVVRTGEVKALTELQDIGPTDSGKAGYGSYQHACGQTRGISIVEQESKKSIQASSASAYDVAKRRLSSALSAFLNRAPACLTASCYI